MRRDFCSQKNLTVGFTHVETGNLLIVKENDVSGIIGAVMHKFYGLDRENLCRFVAVNSFGSKLPNGTLTGALSCFKEGKLDLFGKPTTLFEYQDFLIFSTPVYENGYYTAHTFENNMVESGGGSLKMFDVELWLQIMPFLAFLITFLFLHWITPHLNLIIKSELIVASLLQISFTMSKSMNIVSLVILFFGIYLMIYKSILTNGIKTNSVVVDTSQLIDSNEDLFNTRRTVRYLGIENDIQMIEEASKGSFLNSLYEKSIKENNGSLSILGSQPKDFMNYPVDNLLVFARSIEINGLICAAAEVVEERFFFSSLKSHYELFDVIYFDKRIDPYFLPIAQWSTEAGLTEKLKLEIIEALKMTLVDKIELFQTKEQYIAEYSQIHIFDYDYIRDSFHLYLYANLIIMALFVCTYLSRKIVQFAFCLINICLKVYGLIIKI